VAYVSRWNPIPERCKVLCHESWGLEVSK
jgi:hypothetical protein